jgi:hypothetical protein
VYGDADELYWRRRNLMVHWMAEEWSLWQRETGQRPTLARVGEFRKRLHELLDTICDEEAAAESASEAAAAAKVVSLPLRGNGGAA